MNQNLWGNINLDIFVHCDVCRLKNGNFKNIKIVENHKKICSDLYIIPGYVQIAISVQKFPEFHIRIFPGFSGSGFFPEKNSGRTWAKSNSLPIFCPLLLHKCSEMWRMWRNVENLKNAKNILFQAKN